MKMNTIPKNPVYRVDADKVRCLNCLAEENRENNGIENEDSSATIYYDENGVLIKKEVKVNETDSSKTKEIITIKTK